MITNPEFYAAWRSKVANQLKLVMLAREHQLDKWGLQNHSAEKWITILGEEFGEAAKAVLENDPAGLKHELIQVAAVAIAFAQNLESLNS